MEIQRQSWESVKATVFVFICRIEGVLDVIVSTEEWFSVLRISSRLAGVVPEKVNNKFKQHQLSRSSALTTIARLRSVYQWVKIILPTLPPGYLSYHLFLIPRNPQQPQPNSLQNATDSATTTTTILALHKSTHKSVSVIITTTRSLIPLLLNSHSTSWIRPPHQCTSDQRRSKWVGWHRPGLLPSPADRWPSPSSLPRPHRQMQATPPTKLPLALSPLLPPAPQVQNQHQTKTMSARLQPSKECSSRMKTRTRDTRTSKPA